MELLLKGIIIPFFMDNLVPTQISLLVIQILGLIQGKGVYQFVDKYGANVDGYR